jgi:quinol monooxygenase YgiN
MDEVYIFVEFSIKPIQRQAFMDHLIKHAKTVRMEQGSEVLEILVSNNSKDRICVWEIWQNKVYWDLHMSNLASKQWQPLASKFIINESITVLQNPGK